MLLKSIYASIVLAALAAFAFPETHPGVGEGVASCNCTDAPITGANIPHLRIVDVTVTTSDDGEVDANAQGTDLSGTAYSGQTIAPGKCKYVRYVFKCKKLESGIWVCTTQSFSLEERDTTDEDCADSDA